MRSPSRAASTAQGLPDEPPLGAAAWTDLGFRLSAETPIHGALVEAGRTGAPEFDMHYGLELGVVLGGRMRRHWPARTAEVQAGEVWLCGMWEQHGWEVTTPSCRHCVLVLLPQWLMGARFREARGLDWMAPFLAPPDERPQASETARAEILAVVRRFEESVDRPGSFRPAFLELLALELLLVLLGEWMPPPGRRPPDLDRYCDSISGAVELALASRRPLATREAAERCGMGPGAFARAFRRILGISFAQFALQSRLGQAAAQLVATEDPVSAVAADWGFSRPSNFQRAFRECYQVLPAEYRHRRRFSGEAASALPDP